MQKTFTRLVLGGAVAALSVAAVSRHLNAGAVTTLAGTAGQPGTADGVGAAAGFRFPLGVAVDGGGTVYVADQSNHVIRRISPGGAVSTVAGLALSPGTADGPGSAARFKYPYGVAVDGAGTLYVSDQYNHTIRKITPAGVVSTFAGMPNRHGSADGIGPAARFHNPAGIAVDAAGTVYVADEGNYAIRKITPAGVVSTLAGRAFSPDTLNGPGADARFVHPTGVAVDAAGTVYVADQENRTIRRISPAGKVSLLAGQSGRSGSKDTVRRYSRFHFPAALAVGAGGDLYVADRFNHTIRVISAAGEVSTLAGTALSAGPANGVGAAARFNCPMGVAVDAAGAVYVTDQTNHTVRVIR
jgi:sugar lactone lactonase YvrE